MCNKGFIVCGDFNRQVGRDREGIHNVVAAFSVGNRNPDGERLVDFALVNGLSIMNTFYKRRVSHKWTYYGWNKTLQEYYTSKSMIDFFLTVNKNSFRDVGAIPSLSVDSAHRMVVATLGWKNEKLRRKQCSAKSDYKWKTEGP